MSYRLTKIYTRKGDDGNTSLRGKRIPKSDSLIEALGTLDELNSTIGLILAMDIREERIVEELQLIQNELFDIGGELAGPKYKSVNAEHVTRLENQIDKWNEHLLPLKDFLLPRGPAAAAVCHIARTICRRGERVLVKLKQDEEYNLEILKYINRLSDYLFVAARTLAKESEAPEKTWHH